MIFMTHIKWAQTDQEKLEIAEWIAGKGKVTAAVKDALNRNYLTVGIILITREGSDAYKRN